MYIAYIIIIEVVRWVNDEVSIIKEDDNERILEIEIVNEKKDIIDIEIIISKIIVLYRW